MSLRHLLIAFSLIAFLTAETAEAQPPKPKDGPLGMKFVLLPNATFYKGGGGGKAGQRTEIREDFEIAVHTVTQEQWQAVMGKNPSEFSSKGRRKGKVRNISDTELMQFPVEMVSWFDAREFIEKLNKRETGQGYQYRFPSDTEWEYACRGGGTSEAECSYDFYFEMPTNDLSSEQANFNGDFPVGMAGKGPNLARTTKGGSYAPNKLGLYDMHGNVQQWCADMEGIGASARAVRGGGWMAHGNDCKAADRKSIAPTLRSSDLGLRLVRVPVR